MRVLRLKTPYTDGTTHVVMSPLEFLQRLAALVPRPRLHLIRFHGVLAPHAKLRALVVPPAAEHDAHPCTDHAPAASARMSWARLLMRVFALDIEHCPHCGGTLKIIAAIADPAVIFAILTHLNLPKTGKGLEGALSSLPARPAACARSGFAVVPSGLASVPSCIACAGCAGIALGSAAPPNENVAPTIGAVGLNGSLPADPDPRRAAQLLAELLD